jgi:hypothetical protein
MIIEGLRDLRLVTQRTYLGEIMLGGVHDLLSPFKAFPADIFTTG